jgi:hypothetical protein
VVGAAEVRDGGAVESVDRIRSSVGPGPVDALQVPDAVKLQILATEHWSLLATRSMVWNEMFSRAGMFLTALSGSVVALSLVAQAADFDDEFRILSLLMLPVVLVIGIGTFLRVSAANNEDVGLVIGMNRLRNAYLQIAPDLEPFFITGYHDDRAGIMRTYAVDAQMVPSRVLSSTEMLVGFVDAVVAGTFAGLLAQQLLDITDFVALAIAGAAAVTTGAILFWISTREIRRLQETYQPRFPG